MRSFIVIVAMLALCWIFTDVRSDNALFNVLAPLGAVVFTVARGRGFYGGAADLGGVCRGCTA
jgi:hypothetical protein